MEAVEATRPVPVPEVRDVRKLLFELLDEPMVCTEIETPEITGELVAVYQGRDGGPLALVVADVGFAAAASAALVKLPPRLVDEAREAGALPDSLLEVYGEVTNIFSALMNSARTPHLVLRRVAVVTELVDDERALLDAPRRLAVKVDIKNYGPGSCAFLCG